MFNSSGPYMGFEKVKKLILGHWHNLLPFKKPPRDQHSESWFWGHGDEGEAWRLWNFEHVSKQSCPCER